MAISNTPLRVYQWGRQAVKATAVAATSKIGAETFDVEPEDAYLRPPLIKGLQQRTPGNETITVRGTRFTLGGPVNYEQLQNLLEMSVKGTITPTGTNPYTWTYTRDPAADPALKVFTLERRISDGTNNIDNEWPYALLSSLRISGEMDAEWRYEAQGFARRIQASTLTAAQVFPTIEIPVVPLSKVFIDSTWATLGTTQPLTQILSFGVTFGTGAEPRRTLDGRTDQDFSIDVINGRAVTLDVEMMLLLEASSGQYATEKTAAEAGTLRAIRIQVDGTSSKQVQIDMLLKHVAGSVFKIDEQDGMDVVALRLQESSDGTNLFRVKVVNAVAAVV